MTYRHCNSQTCFLKIAKKSYEVSYSDVIAYRNALIGAKGNVQAAKYQFYFAPTKASDANFSFHFVLITIRLNANFSQRPSKRRFSFKTACIPALGVGRCDSINSSTVTSLARRRQRGRRRMKPRGKFPLIDSFNQMAVVTSWPHRNVLSYRFFCT